MELRDRTVLVTGGTGFLGQHVTSELRSVGANAVPIGSGDFDLRDRSQIDAALAKHRPDALVHLAAVVGGIGANRAQPGRFFFENAIMGIQLLEAARQHGIEKTLVAGTVCAYPKFTPVPFHEDDLWNGYPEETNAPYGLAKKMLLLQGRAYREQYGMNVVHLLPVNLYGPGDNFDLESGHVIPAMIRKFITARTTGERTVTLWGDGSPTREFVYVADTARAFRLALERYDGPEPINIGSGEEITIRRLAELVSRETGFEGEIVWDTTKPNGQPRRKLSTDRARGLLGFETATTFEQGIRSTIQWYVENQAGVAHGMSN